MEVRSVGTADVALGKALAASSSSPAVQKAGAVAGAVAPVVAVQADSVQQASSLGMFMANSSDEGLPRWKVLTALRVYGLNLKQGAERAAEESAPVEVQGGAAEAGVQMVPTQAQAPQQAAQPQHQNAAAAAVAVEA